MPEMCKNCNPNYDEQWDEEKKGEIFCQDCIDEFRSQCACQICGKLVEFDGYDEHRRISIIEEVGGIDNWENNDQYHFCCRKCYIEKIKPLFRITNLFKQKEVL